MLLEHTWLFAAVIFLNLPSQPAVLPTTAMGTIQQLIFTVSRIINLFTSSEQTYQQILEQHLPQSLVIQSVPNMLYLSCHVAKLSLYFKLQATLFGYVMRLEQVDNINLQRQVLVVCMIDGSRLAWQRSCGPVATHSVYRTVMSLTI